MKKGHYFAILGPTEKRTHLPGPSPTRIKWSGHVSPGAEEEGKSRAHIGAGGVCGAGGRRCGGGLKAAAAG